ncbi:dihydrofolate reductase family protein [Streptomyces microflavus]|uniref:dihydrofolate reductase family protein n=1 Tax=Streptomyces microflavus TaxID=1919 RepID=UPI0033EA2DF0
MKLVLQEFLSLDGVYQGPGSPDEDASDGFARGGWFVPYADEAMERLASTWLGTADAFLFGGRTYMNFARDWPKRANHPAAEILDGLPKYVASDSLATADWNPTTILSGDVTAQVAELKQQPGRDLQVHGSGRLAHSLLQASLVDELRLVIAPVIVGTGRRLFQDGAPPAGLQLVDHQSTPGGLAVHTYRATGIPKFGTYGANA